MAIHFHSPTDESIIVFGMSCSGKTTFAAQLYSHKYLCFDALFPWHLIETFGLSISETLRDVVKNCVPPFVLDGWHLADKTGMFLPKKAKVYLIYAPYEQIINQYRAPVFDRSDYLPMFYKWYYEVDYFALPTRFFWNQGVDFVETGAKEFKDFLAHNRQIVDPSESQGTGPFSCFL